MNGYDPQAIVNSYTTADEASRLGKTADTQIMFEIERWFIERYCPSSGTVIDVGAEGVHRARTSGYRALYHYCSQKGLKNLIFHNIQSIFTEIKQEMKK